MADVCIKVAVRIRPLLPKEVLHAHRVCVRVVPGSSQVVLGPQRTFSFHHAFGPQASQDEVYQECVRPLLDTLLDGYNATVFCYGQTGSGKTYTLDGGDLAEEEGLTDRVAQDLFCLLDESSEVVEYKVTLSYLELYMEELRDLLELSTANKTLHIREDERGNTVEVGAVEQPVRSADELLSVLATGNALRRTGPTAMNGQSSRSHTILTFHLHQRIKDPQTSTRYKRTSKLRLIDLAGSERADKTGNTGPRLKESVHINTGLLALGNVIRALTDPKGTPKHIPYRDAKLTRLLRDSLGGQAHTLMIACVSPSDRSLTETLSVLQFASRARNIRNRPQSSSSADRNGTTTHWDPMEAKVGELEFQVQTLRELLKDKQNKLQKERDKDKAGDVEQCKPDVHNSAERTSGYFKLAGEAGALLAEVESSVIDSFFQRRLKRWQEKFKMANTCQSREEDEKEEQTHSEEVLKPRCKETLLIAEEMIQEKEMEVRQLQEKIDKLKQDCSTHLRELEEEREHNQIKTEQLVNQQIVIDRLRGVKSTVLGTRTNSSISESSERRAQSVPLPGSSMAPRPLRKVHSSPPLFSLERVMAAFKMRGLLLLDALDRKQEVYSPFIEQKNHKSSPHKEEEEEEEFQSKMGFRRSLNRTWTSRQKRLTERNSGNTTQQEAEETMNKFQDQQTKPRPLNKMRSSVKRRIHDLSIAIRIKEELIQEMDKTDKLYQAVDRQGSCSETGGVLAQISLQNQQVRAQTYHSLQHMLQQRAALETANTQQEQDTEKKKVKVSTNRANKEEYPVEQSAVVSWLEQVEEQVLQRRAEQRELEEEQRRRAEVQERREACLQQRDKLQDKRLRSSQVLSQDLLRMSVQLEHLEEQIENSEMGRSEGVSVDELRKEREGLQQRRDALEQQLQDNQVLTQEEEQSLVELEEAIETLDTALEFKYQSIQRKEDKLSKCEPKPCSSHRRSREDTDMRTLRRRLREMSPPETTELLITYFNKVVRLREAERVLLWRCEELELQTSEQGGALRAMEENIQRLALDTDRRLMQQHRDNQRQVQLLLRQLQEMASNGELQEMQERIQHLEKDLFFYKNSSRNLKKQLREFSASVTSTDHVLTPKKTNTNGSEIPSTTHIPTTYTRINSTTTTQSQHSRFSLQNSSSSASFHLQESQNSTVHSQTSLRQSSDSAQSSRSSEKLTPVRIHRRDLRQISLTHLQASRSSTRGQQSIVDTSTETTMMEDSIEVSRKSDT